MVYLAEHGKMTCHSTFRQAMADATGGRITDAPDSPAAAVSDRRFNDRLNSTSGGKKSSRGAVQAGHIVVSIEYMHNVDGPSRVFTGDHLCSGPISDVDFSFGDLRTVGFDNTISWFATYGNCYVAHFEEPYFGGVKTGFLSGPTYIGDLMNDRSTSLQWS
ncbi:hypothetical protein [Actinomadura sp. KC06]|uniref:hypothetical protein n=1 Tax=Actinomadura sp. KC06 TaxID=2530369 RepID=UPI001043D303|nr:hypothetical protein [Actinomadura sp. KC06]